MQLIEIHHSPTSTTSTFNKNDLLVQRINTKLQMNRLALPLKRIPATQHPLPLPQNPKFLPHFDFLSRRNPSPPPNIVFLPRRNPHPSPISTSSPAETHIPHPRSPSSAAETRIRSRFPLLLARKRPLQLLAQNPLIML